MSVRAPARVRAAREAVRRFHYDNEAWKTLLSHAHNSPITEARETYEAFLKLFPTSAIAWRMYIDRELGQQQFGRVEALFKKCLKRMINVDLWKVYLRYIRMVKAGQEGADLQIKNAFEFALEHVQLDPESGDLWLEYLQFLNAVKTNDRSEEEQKTKTLREVYQRAIVIPHSHVDTVWYDYDRFEHALNKQLARAMLDRFREAHFRAKSVSMQLRRRTSALKPDLCPSPPSKGSAAQTKELQVMGLWRALVEYEKTNPLQLGEADVKTRVLFTYNKALQTLRHFPQLWYEAAQYCVETKSLDAAAQFYKAAHQAMPYNLVATFMHADFHESQGNTDEATTVYEEVMAAENEARDRRLKLLEAREARAAPEAEPEAAPSKDEDGDEVMVKSEEGTSAETAAAAGAGTDSDTKESWFDAEPTEKEMNEPSPHLASVFPAEKVVANRRALIAIQYLRFARRSEGMKRARKVFVQLKKQNFVSMLTYLAAADIELHVNNDAKVAKKIWDLGFKEYSREPVFVVRYLDFLLHRGEYNNMRVVFEKAFELLEPQDLEPIWERYVDFERLTGGLPAVNRAEQRRNEATGNEGRPPLLDMLDRYTFLGALPCPKSLRSLLVREDVMNRDAFASKALSSLVQKAEQQKHLFPRPDLAQHIAYMPGMRVSRNLPAETPKCIVEVLFRLPPAGRYDGPRVHVDRLLSVISTSDLDSVDVNGGSKDNKGDKRDAAESDTASSSKKRKT